MSLLKAKIYAKEPAALRLEKGRDYFWCSCGLSKTQPFCDGSHQSTAFEPLPFKPKNKYTQWLCNCEQTKTPPYCDGSHNKLD